MRALRVFNASMLILVTLALSGQSLAHLYVPDVDEAEWNVEISPLHCRLWQQVPAYGRGVFENRAGERQRFRLESQKKVYTEAVAELAIVPPEWKFNEQRRNIGQAPVAMGLVPVELLEPKPSQLLDFLEAGFYPEVSHPGWHPGHRVEVQISSINFTAAYQEYLQCLGGLYPANFDQLERTTVLFETDNFDLSPKYFDRLKLIKGYLDVDPEVVRIIIDGHTDVRGRSGHNWDLSRNRAEVVAAYLRKLGITDDKLMIRYHGEQFPVAKNKAPKRARNRRTTIRLDKEE